MELFGCLQSFIEVVEHNGFTNAARYANLPTSAYSKRISWLESHLGLQLFERTTRRIEVTPAGKAYYHDAKKILLALETAKQRATETYAEPQGNIKLTLPTSIGRSLIIPRLSGFFAQYPKITIEMLTTSSPANVSNNLADMAVTVIKSDDAQLVCERLCTTRRHLYGSPAYLQQYGKPRKIADLARHSCLVNMTTSQNHCWRFSNDQEIKVSGPLACDGNSDLIDAAVNGMGLIWLADTAVNQEVAEHKLVALPLNDTSDPEIDIYLYYRPAAPKSPVRLLAKYLISTISHPSA